MMSMVLTVSVGYGAETFRAGGDRSIATSLAAPKRFGMGTERATHGESVRAGFTGIACPVMAPRARWAAVAALSLDIDLLCSERCFDGDALRAMSVYAVLDMCGSTEAVGTW